MQQARVLQEIIWTSDICLSVDSTEVINHQFSSYKTALLESLAATQSEDEDKAEYALLSSTFSWLDWPDSTDMEHLRMCLHVCECAAYMWQSQAAPLL